MTAAEKSVIHMLTSYGKLMKLNSISKPKEYEYDSIYHFILENGTFIKSSSLTTAERIYVNNAIEKMGFEPQYKQCYYNAQMIMLTDDKGEIQYSEGLAQSIIPVMHGFNTINGKLIDLTWRDDEEQFILGKFSRNRAYYGVKFNKKTIIDRMKKTGFAGSIIDNYQEKFPVLKTKFKILP
jgi:hypothetical protein